jgi:hypothetical protein
MDEQLQPQNGGAPRRERRLILPAALAAALVAGGVTGSVLGGPSISAALQEDDTTTTTESTTTESSTTESTAAEDADEDADAECGPGGPGGRWLRRLVGLSVAADALGVTEVELAEALRDGSSIADVAEEQGVDVQTVIDALVASATAAIDERLAAGDLDEEQATALKEDLKERITDRVNGEGFFGPGHRGRGPRGPGDDEREAAADDAEDTTEDTTEETDGS